MSSRHYGRMSIEEFGQTLIDIGDLDPVYTALYKCEFEEAQLCRWLVAYWCLYNCGLASWLSEQEDEKFWEGLRAAADNATECPVGGRWPRGAERRHWRGIQAMKSYTDLHNRFRTPEELVKFLSGGELYHDTIIPYTVIRDRVLTLTGFGDWIAFKVGDMLERLGIIGVEFTNAQIFMFSEPRKSALLLFRQRAGLPDSAKIKDEQAAIARIVSHLLEHFKGQLAPPHNERELNLQEIETILCKWKSHMNGYYPVGNDIIEITEGLKPWSQVSKAAALFSGCLPKV